MDLKKLDIKTVFIIILSLALIISFFVGQKNKIDYRKDEIKVLHVKNNELLKKNDSLAIVNKTLDKKIAKIDSIIKVNDIIISEKQSQIEILKRRKNEIPSHVNVLSANGVASSLSKYIEKTRKSSSSN
jgi:hypothetical protein